MRPQRIETVKESAHNTLNRSASDLLACGIGANAIEHAGGLGAIGCALTIEVGQQRDTTGAKRGRHGQRIEARVIYAEQTRHGVGDLGGIERAHQRQVATGGVGETGDRSGGVDRGRV